MVSYLSRGRGRSRTGVWAPWTSSPPGTTWCPPVRRRECVGVPAVVTCVSTGRPGWSPTIRRLPGCEGLTAGGRHDVGCRQERGHHGAVPVAGPPWGAGGAVQGPEHVQQLDGGGRTRRGWGGDRSRAVDPGDSGRGDT